MRRRLVAALVGVALGTLLLYAGPRTFMISDMVRAREELGLTRTADLVAESIDLRIDEGLTIDERQLESLLGGRADLEIRVRLGEGSELVAGSVSNAAGVERRALADGGSATVAQAAAAVDQRVRDALVPVAAFGVAATAFAIAVALVLARGLARPFTRLAAHAELLGIEDAHPAPRAGVPEADELADALDRSQARIADLLRAEREFSSNASHQLRTPLAALRLRIEDVSTWSEVSGDVRTELDAALGEVDRLADTVTDLLELARSGGIGGWRQLDLRETAVEAAARWQARFQEACREIVVSPHAGDAGISSSERAVHHVLDVLFENALVHGAGDVRVSLRELDEHLSLRVADEGRFDRDLSGRAFLRRARSASSGGSGIGLDLARGIAESVGGRLTLVSEDPTAFELTVPRQGAVPVRS